MIGFSLIDVDTNTDRQLMRDVADAVTIWAGPTFVGRASPYGWDAMATMRVGADVNDCLPGEWPARLITHPDVANALGYHEQDDQGRPILKIFTSLLDDVVAQLAGVVSHEVGEAIVDPECARMMMGTDGRVRATEIADAVEQQNIQIKIPNGKIILCSAFVTPAWMVKLRNPTGIPVAIGDGTEGIQPGQILPGGYMSYFENGSWTQETNGEKSAYRKAVAGLYQDRHYQRVTRLAAGTAP